MTESYYVYLSNDDEEPEPGGPTEEHVDWVSFICTEVGVAFINSNEKTDLPAHKSFIIKMGNMNFSVTLKGCLIRKIATSTAGSTCWNDFIEFVGKHVMTKGDTFYLWIKEKMVDGTERMQFFDDNGDMQDYMQCRIKSFRFSHVAKKQTATGSVKLEEEWG